MSRLTYDPDDPDLTHGSDETPHPQAEVYLVEKDTGEYVRPVRRTYVHRLCGGATTMGPELAKTYAMDPTFYGATYCVKCQMHRPVSEFRWDGTDITVGT